MHVIKNQELLLGGLSPTENEKCKKILERFIVKYKLEKNTFVIIGCSF